ncbi:transglutaminase [Bifidobacterium dolichotidis]|uniref:Transglutaminase n=1 Tax=Bifidobacterium dolichotidis TaxID=2306976 RepID=A0A430FRR4_9BIFI|nr:transglutaminase domain-containing protein [Bifidobacterium dolichotidis]RSX55566.1 transglutaminase [Bifidobacterium dolichotidis]
MKAFNSIVPALLSLLAVVPLIDVYGSLALWASAALPAACCATLIALHHHRYAQWPVTLLLSLVSQFVIAPVLCCNNTTIAGFAPTPATVIASFTELFPAFQTLLTSAVPVSSNYSSLLVVWTLTFWGTLLSCYVAQLHSRLEFLCCIPALALLTVASLLGASTTRFELIAGLAMTLLYVLWFSWRYSVLRKSRSLAIAVQLVLCSSVTFALALWYPTEPLRLRDHLTTSQWALAAVSPLSIMRSYVQDYQYEPLLTVQGLPDSEPIRLAVMDYFDGNIWTIAPHATSRNMAYQRYSNNAALTQASTTYEVQSDDTSFTATVTVHNGLHQMWLPTAGQLRSLNFATDSDRSEWLYSAESAAAVVLQGLQRDTTYTFTSIPLHQPSEQQINAVQSPILLPQRSTSLQQSVSSSQQPALSAQSSAATQQYAGSAQIPDAVQQYVTATISSDLAAGQAMLRLARSLHVHGAFSHGLANDYPSAAGHGIFRITQLLNADLMVGDSEQYASALALMGRCIGLETRIVLGFQTADKQQQSKHADDQSAQYPSERMRYTGSDIKAWVEAKLDGLGWVAFDPTPDETQTPESLQQQQVSEQTMNRQPPIPLNDPIREQEQPPPSSVIGGDDAEPEQSQNQVQQQFWRIGTTIAWCIAPIVLVILGFVAAIALQQHRRKRQLWHGRVQARIAYGWSVLVQTACIVMRHDAKPLLTQSFSREEQASVISAWLKPQSNNRFYEAARLADQYLFAGRALSTKQAHDYAKLIEQLRRTLLNHLPRIRKWFALMCC